MQKTAQLLHHESPNFRIFMGVLPAKIDLDLPQFVVMTRNLDLTCPGLGLVSDLCHSYPGKGISEDFKEQKWLKISPNKSVT